MAKHRKIKSKYNGKGKHRVVTPKRNVKRAAIAVPLSVVMALYPSIAGDGEGLFPSVENVVPFLDEVEAVAEEVISDPIEKPKPPKPPVVEVPDIPVVDLPSPAH